MATVGAFLVEKMTNMQQWLRVELQQEDRMPPPSQLVATMVASHLASHHLESIQMRDTAVLLQDTKLPPQLRMWLETDVIPNVHLHERFWRYLEAFVIAIEPEVSFSDPTTD